MSKRGQRRIDVRQPGRLRGVAVVHDGDHVSVIALLGLSRRNGSSWHRAYRTLYGARMAARQARIDYSPGGRLYAEGGK